MTLAIARTSTTTTAHRRPTNIAPLSFDFKPNAKLLARVRGRPATPLCNHGDQFHLRDNWEGPQPLGWLLRDHAAWWRSYRFTKTLVERTGARLLFGHDAEVLAELRKEPFYD